MKYRCRSCKKEFDVLAWNIETTNWWPQPWTWPQDETAPEVQISTNYSTSAMVKKPCCPFCGSLEIEETKKKG